jgi:hypothetical protein
LATARDADALLLEGFRDGVVYLEMKDAFSNKPGRYPERAMARSNAAATQPPTPSPPSRDAP